MKLANGLQLTARTHVTLTAKKLTLDKSTAYNRRPVEEKLPLVVAVSLHSHLLDENKKSQRHNK